MWVMTLNLICVHRTVSKRTVKERQAEGTAGRIFGKSGAG